MAAKEAKARIKINRLLEESGWRFFDGATGKTYATDGRLREIIEKGKLTELNVNPAFSMTDFKAVPREWRDKIPEYVKDYVSLNQFM